MNYQTKHDAETAGRAAKRQMPPGWAVRVWENLGWHMHLQNGPATVWEFDVGRWICMIGRSADTTESGGTWGAERTDGPYKSPAAAFRAEYRRVFEHIAGEQKRFAALLSVLQPMKEAAEKYAA